MDLSTNPDIEPRPGPSKPPRTDHSDTTIVSPVVALGPPCDTYEEEFDKLRAFLQRSGNVLGPCAPVIFVNIVRNMFKQAKSVVNDHKLKPYDKCMVLFRIFDAIVLAYKNIAFVYCNQSGVRSVYGYSERYLKIMLSRVEAFARKVATAIHDTYSLAVLNEVVASTEQRLTQVRSDRDMAEFFRAASGGTDNAPTYGIVTRGSVGQLPHSVERYRDPYPEVDTLLRRLRTFNSDSDYVRDFYDALYLLATANSATTLTNALETRLADKDRNVVLFEAPGDRLFASSMCASAIAFLRKTLLKGARGASTRGDTIETYRINYGRIFSKYRGDSERNFTVMMEWIKSVVRGNDTFRVFWFPDIENLMSPRTANDQEHIATIKNAMLQHMDDFNKDKTLRSFLLLFHSSEGALDSAFSRRLETVIRTPVHPLTEIAIAKQVVSAELARYRINLTDGLIARVIAKAAVADNEQQTLRTGGFAYVQATLRDMYVNQKLALRYDARSIDVTKVSHQLLRSTLGRYFTDSSRTADTLYDLDERPIEFNAIGALAFNPSSDFAVRVDRQASVPIKYNSNVQGDPKNIDGRSAARTAYLHDI